MCTNTSEWKEAYDIKPLLEKIDLCSISTELHDSTAGVLWQKILADKNRTLYTVNVSGCHTIL